MRRFVLNRHKDISGVSGLGIVAEGIQFQDGQCVLSWLGRYHTVEVLPDLNAVLAIHGHEGNTTIDWVDPTAGV